MTKSKSILFIVSRLPINLETGDRVRVYNFIKGLSERGYRVDIIGFVPAAPYTMRTDIELLCERCVGIEKKGLEFKNPDRQQQLKAFWESLFRGFPYRVWQWNNAAFMAEVFELTEKRQYEVIHFSSPAAAIAFDRIRRKKLPSRLVFDFIDAFSLKLKNAASRSISWNAPFRWIDSLRLKKFEQKIARLADRSIIISERDKKYIGRDDIHVIPNGIENRNDGSELNRRDIDLLFTGNISHSPNINAMKWFARRVMPELILWDSSINLYIAGKSPPASIQKLESEHINVTGYVEHMDDYYRRANIFVCPMRYGAGQKNKILEAMINRCPVISTTEGNFGIDAPAKALAIADSAKEFIAAIKRLLTHEQERSKMGEAGYDFARSNYSWGRSIDLLEQCYKQ